MEKLKESTLLLEEAAHFIETCYLELGKSEQQIRRRVAEIEQEIGSSGSYVHTMEELQHGARMAWRNNNRCIGRLFWQTLEIFDERDAETEEQVFSAIVRHLRFAFNGGQIRPAITVFKQSDKSRMRIWNHQLLRYAAYERDGRIIGDSSSLALTQQCEALGWRGAGSDFDLLPVVIGEAGKQPKWFELPADAKPEVEISHPDWPVMAELGVKWYAVPLISDMKLEIGGIEYCMAPFNGWYMGTEIGARNLADEDRYGLLPKMAEIMGLDTSSQRTLWKDKALVELNVAVLESFAEAGVTIVDHHTAAKQFKNFEKIEEREGRKVTGNWAWLIPPVSPATTHIFHKPYKNDIVKPNYFYQQTPYKG
ncbi:nitric oxide synthase oxygenase [Planococcus maitriensis]|uniref:Nitric oxide synthase oxygenase n=1 Tax=Planococcus maitriensis TaxID=221799 RepID=A0A365K959_9BACL|nr:nitric oxide synthase oxygenase [Planococcus maitriensis]RAZ69330.1 nitric oxide synthase [Planococcus maitriensis]